MTHTDWIALLSNRSERAGATSSDWFGASRSSVSFRTKKGVHKHEIAESKRFRARVEAARTRYL